MNKYLDAILHDISQGMLVPTIIALILLIVGSIFIIAQIIVEYFTERRYYKQNMPGIINAINDAKYDQITSIVCDSSLLRFQKCALMVVSRNMGLPEEPLFALAQVQIEHAEKHYKNRIAWTDTISKIAPLLGLMGTLIPLGPGIVALGNKDVSQLSNALLVAFDATVCGLICAIVSLIISKIRSGWYTSYINVLESLMSVILDKAAHARAEGVQLPKGYKGDPYQEFKQADRARKLALKAAQEQAAVPKDLRSADAQKKVKVLKSSNKPVKPEKPEDGKHEGRFGFKSGKKQDAVSQGIAQQGVVPPQGVAQQSAAGKDAVQQNASNASGAINVPNTSTTDERQ